MIAYMHWLDAPDGDTCATSPTLRQIRDYNCEDCRSTRQLLTWLRQRCAGVPVSRDARPNHSSRSSRRSEKKTVQAHSELQQSLAEAGQKQLELFQEAQDKSSLEALACELAQQLELCREWTGNLEAALSFMQSTASTSVEELHQLDQQNECLVQDTTVSVSACQGHSLKEERELSSAELQELLQADDTHVLDKQLQEAEQCRMKLEETVAALRHDALQLQASVALHRATKELQEELASALERKEATTRSGDELLVEIRQWGHKVRPEDSAFRDSRHPPSSPVQKGEHNLSLESLEHEVQVAEEALLEDLSAKLAAREKRVQFLASRWLHRRLGSPECIESRLQKQNAICARQREFRRMVDAAEEQGSNKQPGPVIRVGRVPQERKLLKTWSADVDIDAGTNVVAGGYGGQESVSSIRVNVNVDPDSFK
ncbi:hypothetical protein AK812_SmicGene6758 [Symbiodinium microadriaticum]|uniref:Uncharacterized protein n=1 Tax=Symbiodinium microadriaticum TaxID=2951 RepID=A0A1Q9EQE7_SYMMI|nr:hypothetical protein AK812_SmicGene6758 [Symbiodinium microadriaticum]